MAQATSKSTGFALRLSALFSDPMVREAFERAERDFGQTFAIPNRPKVLVGGAAERVRELELA